MCHHRSSAHDTVCHHLSLYVIFSCHFHIIIVCCYHVSSHVNTLCHMLSVVMCYHCVSLSKVITCHCHVLSCVVITLLSCVIFHLMSSHVVKFHHYVSLRIVTSPHAIIMCRHMLLRVIPVQCHVSPCMSPCMSSRVPSSQGTAEHFAAC